VKKRAFAAMGLLAVALFGCRWDIEQGGGAVPLAYDLGFKILNETAGPLLVTAQVGVIPHRNARFNELAPLYADTFDGLVNLAEGRSRAIKAGKTGSVSFGDTMGIFDHLFDYKTRTFSANMISFVITISRNGETLYRAVGWDVPDEDMENPAHPIDAKMLGFFDPEMQREEHDWPGYPEGIVIFHLTSTAFPGSQGKEETKRIPRTWTYFIRAAETSISLETMNVWSLGPAWPPDDDEFAVIERKWKWWKWWK